MKTTILAALLTFSSVLLGNPIVADSYENMDVGGVTVDVTNAPRSSQDKDADVLIEMRLKAGDKFNQVAFDKDLKTLSEKYQIVDPKITQKDGKLYIHLNITLRPKIVKFIVEGSKYTQKKILEKGELKTPMEYNRGEFYKSITDIRDWLIKRGYFKADVTYKIDEVPGTLEAIAHIYIDTGPLGHIGKIELHGFTKKEEKAIYGMIKSSKFNILTNWLIGSGVLRDDDLDRDITLITHHIQNEGYIDAKVKIEILTAPNDKLILDISLDRGELYHVGTIKVEGNTLETSEELEKIISIKEGDVFKTEKVTSSQEGIKELYTKKGYLDTSVGYELVPAENYTYNIVYNVEESARYKVGLIVVSGNKRTHNNVVYNNIDIKPGEVFDSSKMKQTQNRLQSTGYFKNVSVYAVTNDGLDSPDGQYRDVVVELEENRTAALHFSAGANSASNIFGELSLSEQNFDLNGITNFWTEGLKSFRGAGQHMDIKAMVAAKELSASVSWVNPYINDSLWRFGIDLQAKKDATIADYNLYTFGGSTSAIYPINPFFTSGVKWRLRDSIIKLNDLNITTVVNGANTEATPTEVALDEKALRNNGIVSGGAILFGYNTTDNPYVPHRGLRSNLTMEFAGLLRNAPNVRDFPFLNFGYSNSYYVPLWKNATFKVRGDLHFILPLWEGTSADFPITEKFLLGGVGTVRGYAQGQVGPYYGTTPGDPKGGISSGLFSIEVLQKIIAPLDIFAFFDAGVVSERPFSFSEDRFRFSQLTKGTSPFKTTAGVGIRLNLGQPLPFVLGYGYPFNPDPMPVVVNEKGEPQKPDRNPQIQNVFFSMSGQF